jgi:hypothetical protein
MAIKTEQVVIGVLALAVVLYLAKDYIMPATTPAPAPPKKATKPVNSASPPPPTKETFENGDKSIPKASENLEVPPSAEVVPRSIKYLEDKRQTSTLESEDLLPDDTNSTWSNVDPKGQGSLAYKNWLEAGYNFGVNTVGSSLKNANRDIRSEPTNPQEVVAPWRQSSIESDMLRRPLE